MSDLIDRQAAIDAHYEYCNKHPDASFPVWSLKILEDLPSAQPETHDKRTETHGVCLDTIDRQAAIDALDKRFDSIPMEQTTEILLLRKDLRELPSAQPDLSEYSDKLWKKAYERGRAEADIIVRCKDCKYWIAHDKRCVYLNHGFAPNMWCCHGRRTDD